MKVIVNRFKVIFPKLISQEQAGFIAGRNISDNIILAQEVIRSMRRKRKGKNWMAIKLDLEKAYSRVSWEFIATSLSAIGIPIFLQKVIMSAISSSSIQILWNGMLAHKFKPIRGICQGCPLSPYLFILYMDCLGHIIRTEMENGPSVSHLFFADELVIFGKAHLDQTRLLDSILNQFCEISGHRISVTKSNIFFSKITSGDVRKQIIQTFGFQEVQNLVADDLERCVLKD
ncbi:LINE-1 reverse transcriptase isogeny [Gossypium australe]|uniref:LINE-1 reverse transcriptase isogeny n=1 Tax=Gossypium australe TaxID=47621 RepID=A0A5B6V8L9_9ROSI|nr:LINE-1 reverse transcriptase isogeny [Gossypium australe]